MLYKDVDNYKEEIFANFPGGLEILGIWKIGNTREILSFRVFPIKQTTRVIEDDWKKYVKKIYHIITSL